MKKLKFLTTISVITLAFVLSGCSGGGGSSSDPNQGFKILTYAETPFSTQNPVIPTSGRVQGLFLNGTGNYGSVTDFDRFHGGVGYLVIGSAKLPGNWRLALGSGFDGTSQCLTTRVVDRSVSLGQEIRLYCPGRFVGFLASPDSIDASNPTGSATFTGEGVDDTYGAPMLAYYDDLGNISASTLAADYVRNEKNNITGIVANAADLSQAYNGLHTVAIHNKKADGSYEIIGGSSLVVFGNEPPPPPPPGDCNSLIPGPGMPCQNY